MIPILLSLVILILVVWAVNQLLPLAGLPAPVHQVLLVVIVVIALIWFVNRIMGSGL